MRKILSALFSTLQGGVRGGLLFLALLSTTTLWAYDFQSGDLYYNITSDTTVEVTYQYAWSSDNYAGLTTATIPETVTYDGTTYSVTSIGGYAFRSCSSLTSITIPNSVTSIGDDAFSNCDSLTSITIGNSVTSIGDYAFSDCSSLTSITIPNSVTSIGDRVFFGCDALTSVTIGNSVTSIGDGAFFFCVSLTSVTIPNSVTSIGEEAFHSCDALTSITIPNSVTSIGKYAFYGCRSLTSVTIPNSVTSIGDRAFGRCSALTSVTIPNSVTSIGDMAFYGCSALTSIVVESGNSNYDSRENCNAIIETATNTLVAGCQNTIIPSSVTSIGEGAFWGCKSLTSVTIPNSVTSIGNYAFSGCSALTSITIPNSVTSIGNYAFAWCSALKTVICEAIEVPELLGDDVFYDMPLSEATLYVPAQSLDDYKAADQWKDFGTILPIHESPTNIEHTPLGEIGNQSKLLRNGQVYILQDGKTYTIMGQEL